MTLSIGCLSPAAGLLSWLQSVFAPAADQHWLAAFLAQSRINTCGLLHAEAPQPDNPLLTQLNELWAAVKGQDADDFTTWTSLVSTAEKLVSRATHTRLIHWPSWWGCVLHVYGSRSVPLHMVS